MALAYKLAVRRIRIPKNNKLARIQLTLIVYSIKLVLDFNILQEF